MGWQGNTGESSRMAAVGCENDVHTSQELSAAITFAGVDHKRVNKLQKAPTQEAGRCQGVSGSKPKVRGA